MNFFFLSTKRKNELQAKQFNNTKFCVREECPLQESEKITGQFSGFTFGTGLSLLAAFVWLEATRVPWKYTLKSDLAERNN